VSTQLDGRLAALASGARLLARTGMLDAQLDGLAAGACSVSGATSCLIYLLDGEQGVLQPGGSAGIGDLTVEPIPPLAVNAAADAGDPVAAAVLARRTEIVPVTESMRAALAAAAGEIVAMGLVPLVTQDGTGAQEVQGLLVVGLAEEPADAGMAADLIGGLDAIGDLAASAVRAARLEQALVERSDWYDRLAHTDPLTGLANRRTFDRMFELELARAGRQATPLSLVLFDIDGLGTISARHGADVGDDVLRRVAATLADSVRLVDTVARYGGDEFIVLAPGSAGSTVAERVVRAVGDLDPVDGGARLTLSAGVVRFPDDGASADELLAAVDEALGRAKATAPGTISERG
jgi:diguanylate cyclase (GGDEF)-like protein